MSCEILVEKYPGNDGKLFRDLRGIVYTGANKGVTALGYDKENVGIISPIDSDDIRALIHADVVLDDSLARECQSMGGLFANSFQVVGDMVICVPRKICHPVSLFETTLDYIIKNHTQKKFDLELLPTKLKNNIRLRSLLNNKRIGLEKMRHLHLSERNKKYSLHAKNIKRLEEDHLRKIRGLDNHHEQTAIELGKIASGEEAKILYEIKELENIILESL